MLLNTSLYLNTLVVSLAILASIKYIDLPDSVLFKKVIHFKYLKIYGF